MLAVPLSSDFNVACLDRIGSVTFVDGRSLKDNFMDGWKFDRIFVGLIRRQARRRPIEAVS